MEKKTSKVPAWLVVLGIFFMVTWRGGAFVLGAMRLRASVMANDFGSANAAAHLGLIAAVMGGLAFFSPGKRKSSGAPFSPCWSVACSS